MIFMEFEQLILKLLQGLHFLVDVSPLAIFSDGFIPMPMTRTRLIEVLHTLRRAACATAALALIAAAPVLMQAERAAAQTPSFSFGSRSYITPFPQTDRYQVHVIGDGLAEGLAGGLTAAFEKDGTVRVVNSSKAAAGLSRPDRTDLAADAEALAKSQGMHVAVVMVGINDMRNIRSNDGTQRWGTDGWRDAYAKEVDRLIKTLKDNNVGIYWVGMPVMSNAKTSEAMGTLNDIFRERTYVAGVKFIDTWNGFTDQFGAFASYGPDLSGQTKRLREADGVFFTAQGNRKLANYVEVLLRRDLAAAKAERNIPLAGDDEEQSRLIPKPEQEGSTPAPDARPADGVASNAAPSATGPVSQQPGDQGQTAGQPPKTPSAPIAGAPTQFQVPRQLSFRPGDAPQGETIVGDIDSGVTSLATVSTLNDLNANLGERRLPTQERLYYKTLIRGQALKPKPGRADDFKWPRS
jgi:uncharacterized protein